MGNDNKECDVLFLYPPYEKRVGGGSMFPLGIGYLISSVKQAGFTFAYIDCQDFYCEDSNRFVQKLADEISKKKYLVIAISCITTAAVPFLEDIITACRISSKSIPIILGGQLVSIDYVEKLFFEKYNIDAICKGDGDEILPALIKHLKDGNIIDTFFEVSTPKRTAKKHYIENIDLLPFPYRNREIVSKMKLSFRRSSYASKTITMITSRGCAYSCSYCVSGCNSKQKFKKRSWQNIVEEIKHLQKEYQIYSIVFYDDCFFYNKKTADEDVKTFIQEIKKQKCEPFEWQIEIRADVVTAISSDSWKLLYQNGCRQINIGVESCYEDTLRFLGKEIKLEVIEEAFDILQSSVPEMILAATYIVGGPNSDREHILKLAEFSKRMGLLYIRLHPLELHPGTKIYESIHGKSDAWYQFIVSNKDLYACMYYEEDKNKLMEIMEFIKQAYCNFYLSEYWYEKAKDFYGEDVDEKQRSVIKVYGLDR